jgi:lipid-A-disaccharide synthase-like uncharacterized protein
VLVRLVSLLGQFKISFVSSSFLTHDGAKARLNLAHWDAEFNFVSWGSVGAFRLSQFSLGRKVVQVFASKNQLHCP